MLLRSLIFSCLFLSMILLAAPVMAQDEGDELPGLNIPNGYVVIISLFNNELPDAGVTIYTLGIIRDNYSNTVISAQRAIMASKGNQFVSADQIIVFTARHEVLSSDNLERDSQDYPNSKGVTITFNDEQLLPIDPLPPNIRYDYDPAPDDTFDGILLMSSENLVESEPIFIQAVKFTLLPRDKTTNYYPVRVSNPLLLREIYNGFALKNGEVVGFLIKRSDEVLFLIPIDSVLRGPQ